MLDRLKVVINWIQGKDKRYKQFVQNRLEEIRKRTEVSSWFHVPVKENVADLP